MDGSKKLPEEAGVLQDPLLERVFLADDLVPNAGEAFRNSVLPLDEVIKIADVVLDTNVLLLPYGAGSNSLSDIVKAFRKLAAEKRLYLPGQVAREFIRNRPNKLGELQQQLSDKMSRYLSIEKLNFPVLEGTKEYASLNEVLEKTAGVKRELSAANQTLLRVIKSWEWNDPVNTAYRDVFVEETIVEPKYERKALLAELQRRHRLLIPPGYKDASKDDLGVGDFLIWKTITDLGERNKNPLIFVSGEEKADWQHRSGGTGFLPRFELLDEYRRASSGKAFYIIPLSKMLELLNVESTSVEEIKQEEVRIQEASSIEVDCPYCDHGVFCKLAEQVGSTTHPRCVNCSGLFHVHRTRNGVMVRGDALAEKESTDNDRSTLVEIECPNCSSKVEEELGLEKNATTWCTCQVCNSRFPIHRKRNGDVMVSRESRS